MAARARRLLAMPLLGVLAVLGLSGCVAPWADSIGRYTPVGNAPVIVNDTPYSAALRCLKTYTAVRPLRIAVGQIADYTGKREADNGSRKVTQGAALMAMSALSKAGVPLVERFDTSVAEMELNYANVKLIDGDKQGSEYRRILAGSIPGSDFYLIGGITELDFNIRSPGASGDGGATSTNGEMGAAAATMYVMNVGLDLRVIDTNTLEVVDVISYKKQIIGRQEPGDVFDIMGQTFFDASRRESALEPIQLAVRSVIERAVLEIVARLYRSPPDACTAQLGSAADPFAGQGDSPQGTSVAPVQKTPMPARPSTGASSLARDPRHSSSFRSRTAVAKLAATHRQKRHQAIHEARWYNSGAPASEPGLRGGIE
jgi:curli production assembly/transport component CsgG/holdfast attachment protein HfaB